MGNKTINVIVFLAGAVVGSLATKKFVETKYNNLAAEEIEAVREYYRTKEDEVVTERKAQILANAELTGKIEVPEGEKKKYAKLATDYSAETEETIFDELKKRGLDVAEPYTISPENFDEFEDYESISLIYYADGVLADENDEVIDDIEDTVGNEALDCFGEYEEDAVFVRNDERKTDYEILLDLRTYAEVTQGPQEE